MIYEFKGFKPVIDESAFIHPQSAITGNVTIGKNVYIGPGAAIRADFGEIIIEDGCNVQENCTIHMFPGVIVRLHRNAHVGHGAIIHGATLLENCLVGMNAVIMDNVVVGRESIIGALAFVPEGMEIPSRKIAVGNPAKIIKDVTDEMVSWKTKGTEIYQKLSQEMHNDWQECIPQRQVNKDRRSIAEFYSTWGKTKD